MVPVQVGTRIVDLVDSVHAARMGQAKNAILVRARRSNAIVRVILEVTSSGENTPSDNQNSRVAHKRESLLEGSATVFALKPSRLFELTGSGNGEKGDGTHHPYSTRRSIRKKRKTR